MVLGQRAECQAVVLARKPEHLFVIRTLPELELPKDFSNERSELQKVATTIAIVSDVGRLMQILKKVGHESQGPLLCP